MNSEKLKGKKEVKNTVKVSSNNFDRRRLEKLHEVKSSLHQALMNVDREGNFLNIKVATGNDIKLVVNFKEITAISSDQRLLIENVMQETGVSFHLKANF